MKIVVFYYTQSGQALEAAKRIFGKGEVVYKQIVPEQAYPFPWSTYEFFDAFPETRLLLPPSGILPLDLTDVGDADLVAVVGQSWYLSPSLPLQSFFADEQVRSYLRGRKVVFVNVCRNMWLMTSRWLKSTLSDLQARLVGHIVLQDNHPNLVSAATIVRWLLHGRKEASGLLPKAGVSETDIQGASRFGDILRRAVTDDNYDHLQDDLLAAGAIKYKPSVLQIEKIGHRMFGLWAPFIRKKGGFGAPERRPRVMFFYRYLVFALFFVSPFVQLLFLLTSPLRGIGRNRRIDCSV